MRNKMICEKVYIFWILTSMSLLCGASNVKDCEADFNCLPGYYCYKESLTCAPCTDCKSYNRLPKEWKKCEKHPKECGSCISGYEEEIFTEGKIRDMCIFSEEYKFEEKEGVAISPLVLWAGVVCTGIIFIIGGGYVYWKKNLRISGFREDKEKGPPPYSRHSTIVDICQPTAPPHELAYHDNSGNINLNPKIYVDNENLQQSVCTKPPSPEGELNNSAVQDENSERRISAGPSNTNELVALTDSSINSSSIETQESLLDATPNRPRSQDERRRSVPSERSDESDDESDNESEEPFLTGNRNEPSVLVIHLHNTNNNQNTNVNS